MARTLIGGVVFEGSVPQDREFRAAWVVNNGVVEIDPVLSAPIHKRNAKITVSNAINANIDALGAVWQVDERSLSNIDRAVNIAVDNPGGPQTMTWTLANNSNRAGTTVANLKSVRTAHGTRQSAIIRQYQIWRAGSMQSPFVIT